MFSSSHLEENSSFSNTTHNLEKDKRWDGETSGTWTEGIRPMIARDRRLDTTAAHGIMLCSKHNQTSTPELTRSDLHVFMFAHDEPINMQWHPWWPTGWRHQLSPVAQMTSPRVVQVKRTRKWDSQAWFWRRMWMNHITGFWDRPISTNDSCV